MKYETLFVVRPDLDEEAYKAEVARFSGIITEHNGTVENVDEWEKRKLAYEIEDFTEGYFVVMTYTAAPEMPAELERNMKNADTILRYMTTKL